MAKAAKTTTTMTKVEEKSSALTTGFEVLKNMGDSISDEMDGLAAVFEQIKIPIGGVTYFDMPGEDPETP